MKARIGTPLVDMHHPMSFEFDGRSYQGFKGDTLASALLAEGVKIMGRSFKYHRPRGLLSDGWEEPNALMQIGKGATQSPNLRATEVELEEGLIAHSQNHLGSLNWDLLRFNDCLAPFLGAGFYYKTFMWPKRFWEQFYEPLIRHAAGLGALSGEEDRQNYERGFLFCDLLIIGSGMAGLEAALLAGEAGADVILVEADFELGGRLIKDQGQVDDRSYLDFKTDCLERLYAMKNLRIMKRSVALGAYDGGIYSVLEQVSGHQGNSGELPRQCFWRIQAKAAILAAGATERPIAFQNNDRAGVMLASAVRAFMNRYGVSPGENIAIFTNNNSGWDLAEDMLALGLAPVAIIDPRGKQRALDIPIYQGVVTNTKGGKTLKSVEILEDGKSIKLDCDCLAMSGGFNPNVHLSCHMGAKPVYDERIAAFVPAKTHVPNLQVVGAAAGVFEDKEIFAHVSTTMQALGYHAKAKNRKTKGDAYRIEPLWAVEGKGRAFLDFQNDVSVKDVKLAQQENFQSVEHMKRYTTLGMATDQGKTANVNALAVMSELTGKSITETGTTTYRPPYHPAPIAAIGAGAFGKGFAPERFTPTHEFLQRKNAVFTEAGLWHRARYFPRQSDVSWRQACDREVGFVREAVGICDVSTLGKILVQGKDAAQLLDWVYAGQMSSLKPGKIRYGIMLREDGMVMDDGTCACLGENQYFITTTTAFAGEVMDHFDFVSQCVMGKSDLHYISQTDHFAQIAVAGPKSRDVLQEFVDEDLSDAALPHMGVMDVTIAGVKGRIYRLSFSGERGYEIGVPRRYGEDLMAQLLKSADACGGGAYGLEALNVLRIEKGFITHAEIDGRVSAEDLGLGKMVSKKKDCIGKVMAARPELLSDERRQLVGIKPIGAVQRLLAGSVMVAPDEAPIRENLQGHVSSVCYSPTLGHMIGLAFVKGGHHRLGEKIRAVDLVRDFDTLCEIVDPVFYDKEGEKLRG